MYLAGPLQVPSYEFSDGRLSISRGAGVDCGASPSHPGVFLRPAQLQAWSRGVRVSWEVAVREVICSRVCPLCILFLSQL